MTLPGHSRPLLALLAGCLFALGLAPLNLWLLIPVSTAALGGLIKDQPVRRSAVIGWWYGLGFWGVGASWVYVSVHDFGDTPLLLAGALTLLFVAGLAITHALFAATHACLFPGKHQWFVFPALWVLFEWMRIWLLSGFPWLFAGYGFIDTPLAAYAPVTGVLGISFIVVMAGCVCLDMVRPIGCAGRSVPLAVLLLLLVGAPLLQHQHWTYEDTSTPLDVSLVQGNIAQDIKWDPQQRNHILDVYNGLSDPLWGHTDLVVWPEAAIPMFQSEALGLLAMLDNTAKQAGSAFISGVPYVEFSDDEHPMRFYNSVFASGQGHGLYHKQTLVPFGEYVPLGDLIRGLLPFFDLPMSSFSAGTADQKPLTVKSFTLAPFICYEIVYPEVVRSMAQRADIMLTISNDAWFGHSFGPLQHFEMARMRALELGRYLIRGTNTGVTAIINPEGKVVSELPRFEEGVLQGKVYRMVGATPLAHTGYYPVLALCMILVIAGAISARRQRILP